MTTPVHWPTTRDEAWRYFPTRALQAFDLTTSDGSTFAVVVGDGSDAALPAGVTVRTANDVGDALALPIDGLTAANHAVANAVVIDVAPGVIVPALTLVHRATSGAVAQPRLVLNVGKRAEVTLLERFEGGADGVVNAATSIVLADGARVSLVKLQVSDPTASHVESVRVSVGRDARFHGFTLSLGGARARTAPSIVLGAPGGEAEVDGLYLARGEQVLDHTMVAIHAAPHTTSKATWAGVLDGRSTGTFQGLITIQPGAVKSKTRELTRTLLLSPTANANAKPELQIDVDDVEASHGAAIGQLDPAQLFYLTARGIAPDDARRMLVRAFVKATLELAPAAFRPALQAALADGGDDAGEGGDDGDGV